MLKINQITVFGGTGFIGRHLIRRLAKTGAIIRVPTRATEKAMVLKPMGDVGQIVPVSCSVRSDDAVAEAIGSSDAVINLIGSLFEKKPDTFQSVHVETAARIARLAKAQGARHFVHMSSLGGAEQSASAYARSKAAGERSVRAFFPESVIMRPSIVFGPEDNFFNLFARLARLSPALPLVGGGHTKFQPVYAGDVAEAITRSLSRPGAQGMTYDLGGPQVYSFRELMNLMLRLTGQRRLLVSLPWGMAKVKATFLELMPNPLLTRDQVEMLKTDNILRDPQAKTFRDLGLSPTALEVILPTYLGRFHKG